MGSFISEAGPLIWPVIILGTVALAAAGRYAAVGGLRLRRFAMTATLTGIAAGALNMLGGVHRALGPLPEMAADKRWIYLMGLRESLNGMIVALTVAVLVGVILSLGGLRFDRHTSRELETSGAEH